MIVGIGIGVCALLLSPFYSAVTWAVALGVGCMPVYRWIRRRIDQPTVAAALASTLVAVAILGPALFVTTQTVRQASQSIEVIQQTDPEKEIEKAAASNAQTAALLNWVRSKIDWEKELASVRERFSGQLFVVVGGAIGMAVTFLITLFLLFYIFRDQNRFFKTVRFLLPVSNDEAEFVIRQVQAMIRSVVYGTLAVSAVQGTLGGMMFWILGLPSAMLWGVIMGLLSIIPMLGAFLIWVPAAIYLAMQGAWMKAAILAVWGAVVVGLIDNWLYPVLVGKEMRMHTVPVFMAIIGGLAVFGAAGLVLGPVFLAMTWSLLNVLRRRIHPDEDLKEA